jgi:hypothetical protein
MVAQSKPRRPSTPNRQSDFEFSDSYERTLNAGWLVVALLLWAVMLLFFRW